MNRTMIVQTRSWQRAARDRNMTDHEKVGQPVSNFNPSPTLRQFKLGVKIGAGIWRRAARDRFMTIHEYHYNAMNIIMHVHIMMCIPDYEFDYRGRFAISCTLIIILYRQNN